MCDCFWQRDLSEPYPNRKNDDDFPFRNIHSYTSDRIEMNSKQGHTTVTTILVCWHPLAIILASRRQPLNGPIPNRLSFSPSKVRCSPNYPSLRLPALSRPLLFAICANFAATDKMAFPKRRIGRTVPPPFSP